MKIKHLAPCIHATRNRWIAVLPNQSYFLFFALISTIHSRLTLIQHDYISFSCKIVEAFIINNLVNVFTFFNYYFIAVHPKNAVNDIVF